MTEHIDETMEGPEAYLNFGVEETIIAAVVVNSPPSRGSEGGRSRSQGPARPTAARKAQEGSGRHTNSTARGRRGEAVD
jgi:hypothetical protein